MYVCSAEDDEEFCSVDFFLRESLVDISGGSLLAL